MNRNLRLLATGAVCILILTFLAQKTTSYLAEFLNSRRTSPDRTKWMSTPFAARAVGIYEAPLSCDSSRRIPDEYTVFLHHGYSLEQHKQAVGGVDLDAAIKTTVPEQAARGISYFAALSDAELVAVRADVGADLVECNVGVGLVD